MSLRTLIRGAAIAGAAAFAALLAQSPAMAADTCSGTADFTWASKWSSMYSNAQAWQFPGTNTCLGTSSGLGTKKLSGKLYQQDSDIWISIEGGQGTRSEIRSKNVVGRAGTYTGTVTLRSATSGKSFTAAQLLNSTPSVNGGGSDPTIRLEVSNGNLDIHYYTQNGNGAQEISNALTGLNNGSTFSWQITQWAGSNNNSFDIEVRINGVVKLSRRTVNGYDSANSYFKFGCYMQGGTGCTNSFSAISFGL
jgi:hypothetical protein